MNFNLNFLKESEDDSYSVRKFLAYMSGLVFFSSCIYTMIMNAGPLDAMQYSILTGVFGFYFLKKLFQPKETST